MSWIDATDLLCSRFFDERISVSRKLFCLAKHLDRVCSDTGIARTTGGSLSVAGGILALVALGLAPVTGGASTAALAAVGTGTFAAVAGAGATLTAAIIKDRHIRKAAAEVKEALEKLEAKDAIVCRLFDELNSNLEELSVLCQEKDGLWMDPWLWQMALQRRLQCGLQRLDSLHGSPRKLFCTSNSWVHPGWPKNHAANCLRHCCSRADSTWETLVFAGALGRKSLGADRRHCCQNAVRSTGSCWDRLRHLGHRWRCKGHQWFWALTCLPRAGGRNCAEQLRHEKNNFRSWGPLKRVHVQWVWLAAKSAGGSWESWATVCTVMRMDHSSLALPSTARDQSWSKLNCWNLHWLEWLDVLISCYFQWLLRHGASFQVWEKTPCSRSTNPFGVMMAMKTMALDTLGSDGRDLGRTSRCSLLLGYRTSPSSDACYCMF